MGINGSTTRAATSFSVISTRTSVGFATPTAGSVVPPAAPETTTLFPITARSTTEATSSLTAVIVTVPVLVTSPAAMVNVIVLDVVKSSAAAFVPAAADTAIVSVACDAWLSAAVTVVTLPAPLSLMRADDSTSLAVGAASSSVIVSVALGGFATPWPPDAVPDTVASPSGASTASSSAVIVTTPTLAVCPAAMVSAAFALSVTSPEADTVIVVASLDAPLSLAVTVVTLPAPLSSMRADDSTSLAVGVASSSVIVPVPVAVPSVALFGLLSVTLTVSSGSSTSSPVTVTRTVLLVSPAAKVNVPAVRAV